jgi:hypothetical protein
MINMLLCSKDNEKMLLDANGALPLPLPLPLPD